MKNRNTRPLQQTPRNLYKKMTRLVILTALLQIHPSYHTTLAHKTRNGSLSAVIIWGQDQSSNQIIEKDLMSDNQQRAENTKTYILEDDKSLHLFIDI